MHYLLDLFSILCIGAFLFFAPALAAIAIRRSLSASWHVIFLVLCILYAFAPLLLGATGLQLAEQFNCTVDITIYTCVDAPQYEDWITGLTFAPWGLILTIPSGAFGATGLLVSLNAIQKAERYQLERPPVYFYRNPRRKAIAGICSAIAQSSNFPLLGVRAAAIFSMVWAPMIIPALYVWIWLAFPLRPESTDHGDNHEPTN
ncbi:PspC domain-containing protein [Oscillatoria sp. FACHB-1407]|uniref:PspC domain-containing protein n=1 Tax=Oscillatoria sp. FACHB-1407 TaxID=2692847 RepID=UPI00168528B9|nr:PspC domain-containing protein [Oscillatoria sp. FACHB-1407]MBD2461444.1 PspC domain-containing protein [Oscillatoria sp. FACHB-1407]